MTGICEPREEPAVAAAREAREETGRTWLDGEAHVADDESVAVARVRRDALETHAVSPLLRARRGRVRPRAGGRFVGRRAHTTP